MMHLGTLEVSLRFSMKNCVEGFPECAGIVR